MALVSSKIIDLFTHLERGQIMNTRLVKECLDESVENTLVLAFQTRDIRGGEGERQLFRDLMRIILKARPELSWTLRLIPEYGRWDDVWIFMGISPEVNQAIDEVVLEQFQLDQESESPSLLAKWLPREGSNKSNLAPHFANLLFPLTPTTQRLRVYRKTLAYLNNRIRTTEVKMCARQWSSIIPDSVPSQLLKRNKLAFLNKKAIIIRNRFIRVDDRYPDVLDRVACANNFSDFKKMEVEFINRDPITDLYLILDSPRYDCVRNGLKE